jgi:hypothetical protein
MQWPEDQPLPQDERSFRRKVWRELVRKDHRNVHALPLQQALSAQNQCRGAFGRTEDS